MWAEQQCDRTLHRREMMLKTGILAARRSARVGVREVPRGGAGRGPLAPHGTVIHCRARALTLDGAGSGRAVPDGVSRRRARWAVRAARSARRRLRLALWL